MQDVTYLLQETEPSFHEEGKAELTRNTHPSAQFVACTEKGRRRSLIMFGACLC